MEGQAEDLDPLFESCERDEEEDDQEDVGGDEEEEEDSDSATNVEIDLDLHVEPAKKSKRSMFKDEMKKWCTKELNRLLSNQFSPFIDKLFTLQREVEVLKSSISFLTKGHHVRTPEDGETHSTKGIF